MTGKGFSEDESAQGQVVEETYATTLEPERYEALLTAWSSYIDGLPDLSNEELVDESVNVHFQRALASLDRMGRLRAHEESARLIADQMPGPAVVFRPDGPVISVNSACLKLLGGHVPDGIADLQLDGSAMGMIRSWTRRNAVVDSEDDFLFVASPLGIEGVDSRLLLTRVTLNDSALARQEAILLAAVEVHLDRAMGERLGEVYGLSEAEVDVSLRLSRGDPPEKIARDRVAKLATVRTQIRAILAKLNVSSVTEAVRLLSSFGATMNTARAISAQAPAMREIDRWRRQKTMTLFDGRRLSWMEQGDPMGRPVLFFHHLYLGPLWTEPSVEALARQGWRVIAPSRPGFGGSDGVSADTLDARIDESVRTMAELLTRLETGPVLVIGHANGLIHAQAFAAARPDLARGLLSVSGETSWEEGMEADFPWHHKVFAKTLLRAPSAIGFIARAAVALIDSGRDDFTLNTLHRDSPIEQRAMRRPEIRAVVTDGLRHAVKQGSHGMVSEIRMALTDRRSVARDVMCPFHIIHGAEDNVFTADMVNLFASTVPNVKKTIPVENAGQYMLYTHWPQVISAMEALWRDSAQGRN
ncbi:MAG: alpha/beta fold hydrolase [Henriciella sp.]|uniref:alpha/beta fold hydrolase n=1 Tax=Henriciella sp. TaxID=1968823 RepID=UPI003C75B481